MALEIDLYGIDWKFIFELEGETEITDENHGFVPRMADGCPFPNSGVSFNYGVDLGHLTNDEKFELKENNPALYNKIELYAYSHYRGGDALRLLNDNPITLLHSELVQLFGIKAKGIIAPTRDAYDEATPDDVVWGELSREQRTTIASVAWQYGYLPSRTPKFWKLCVKRDWVAVVAELRNFGDAFKTRRGLEADYLEQSL